MSRSRKIAMMLVALLGALILWLYVVTVVAPEDTAHVTNIPITVEGGIVLEGRNLIITEQDATTLSLDLSTSRVNLNKLNADTIRVTADASRIREPGVYALTCNVSFPDTVRQSDVDLIRKSRDSVTVTVTRLEEKNAIPIELEWTGEVRDGYLLEDKNTVFEPETVSVNGPDFDVAQITRAVVYYDVSDMEETVTETLPVVFLNEAGEEIQFTSNATSVSAEQVTMTLPFYRTKELSLAIETVEGGGVKKENANIEINPSTIQVKGSVEIIEQMEDVLVLDQIDLASIPSTYEKTYTLNLPAGVTNVSGETEVSVIIRLTGVSTNQISVSDIRVINEPEGFETEVSTRVVQVTVRGKTAEIHEIKANQDNGIYILVDLEEYIKSGAFTVPSKVMNPNHPDVSVSETVDISVVISTPEPEPTDNEG